MSTDAAVAEMSEIEKKEILWGREGFGPEYFGDQLVGEALEEVVSAIDFSKLRGFMPFARAFSYGHLHPELRIEEGSHPCMDPEMWMNEDQRMSLTSSDLARVWGLGCFEVKYGLISRDCKSQIPLVAEWVSEKQWQQIEENNDAWRKKDPQKMPEYQVAHVKYLLPMLTATRKLFILKVTLVALKLQPKIYNPCYFRPTALDLRCCESIKAKNDAEAICLVAGATAGAAVLYGLFMMLRSSNYQVHQELEQNERAYALADRLTHRIGR
jgi:hypothetical protein